MAKRAIYRRSSRSPYPSPSVIPPFAIARLKVEANLRKKSAENTPLTRKEKVVAAILSGEASLALVLLLPPELPPPPAKAVLLLRPALPVASGPATALPPLLDKDKDVANDLNTYQMDWYDLRQL